MRRLAARLAIAGIALAMVGALAGCSAGPGLASDHGASDHGASDHGASDHGASDHGASDHGASELAPASSDPPTSQAAIAMVPDSAREKTTAGPALTVAGAPQGVQAKAGILVDAATGQVLWSKDENTARPIASITKVMSALVILKAGGLNRKLTVPRAVPAYVAKYAANAAGLVPGQAFTADELLRMMLILSAADAAYTLAAGYGPGLDAFIAKMNAEAARLGMKSTHFTSPDGLPYPTPTATFSTPVDLVKLGEVAMSYPEFRSIVSLRLYNLAKGDGHNAVSVTNSNALLRDYPGAIGIKDGYTVAAGHTLLFEAVRDGRSLIGDVLGSPANGPASGAKDAANILNWGFGLKQDG